MDGACRTVEGCQESVTRAFDLAAAISADVAPDDGIVRGADLEPARIAHVSGQPGRVDDVGEQDGRKLALGMHGRRRAGQEFLDGIEDLLARGRVKRKAVSARQLPAVRAGNVIGQEAAEARAVVPIVAAVDDERRHGDRAQDRPDVHVQHPPVHARGRSRRHGETLDSHEPSRMCGSFATVGAVNSSIAGSWPQCCSYSSISFS